MLHPLHVLCTICFILIVRKEDYEGDIRMFFKDKYDFGAAWLHIDYAAKNVML